MRKKIDIVKVKQLYEKNMTYEEIGNKLGVSRARIGQVISTLFPEQERGWNKRKEINSVKRKDNLRSTMKHVSKCIICGADIYNVGRISKKEIPYVGTKIKACKLHRKEYQKLRNSFSWILYSLQTKRTRWHLKQAKTMYEKYFKWNDVAKQIIDSVEFA